MVALNIIIAVSVCLLCVVLMCCQIYANRRHSALVGFSTRYLPWCLLHLVLMSVMSLTAGTNVILLLCVNLLFGIFPLMLLASSFLPKNRLVIIGFIAIGEIFSLSHFIVLHYDWYSFSYEFYCLCAIALALVYVLYMFASLWLYIRRIKNVIQKTTVWTMLSLSVDVVYVFFIVGIAVVMYVACISLGRSSPILEIVLLSQLVLSVIALNYRISSDSLFFLMRNHERIILESLNDAPSCMVSGRTSPDELYKDIFARIVDYFERDMPFLCGDLVIEDLVKVVFANKLYISRAISRCAGRNFCQFVNYYRVKHSVEVFRQNPDLKVAELACQCGFNSVGSFTMAFKLYMNENPSDWIRQERSRMIKYKQ